MKLNFPHLIHLTSEHATDSAPPKIPRQLLADMHIIREEEGFKNQRSLREYRCLYDIPATLLEMMQAEEMQKRGRSDTVSTALSTAMS